MAAKTKKTTSTTKKSTTKKTTKRAPQKTTTRTSKMTMPTPEATDTMVDMMPMSASKNPLSSKFLTIALVVVGIALLTYKIGPWFVPAIVNNRPVTRFEIWSRMEKSFGDQTLDDIVNEYTLDSAIKKLGAKVDQGKIDEQLAELETQFESLGGLDAALEQRGLTRADLEKQIFTQLAVEEVLKDKIVPTEEEVRAYYDDNSETIYVDKDFEDVETEIISAVRDSKLRDAFLEWFAQVEEETKVTNFGL